MKEDTSRLLKPARIHPAIARLETIAGEEAFSCLERLHVWAFSERPSGRLGTKSLEDVETWAGWKGEKGKFVESLLACRLLDVDEDGYCIRGFNTGRQGALLQQLDSTENILERVVRFKKHYFEAPED